jgi:integrase/recombinase XerD
MEMFRESRRAFREAEQRLSKELGRWRKKGRSARRDTQNHELPIQTRTPHCGRGEPTGIRCNTHEEKLIAWTLRDTGLRVADLTDLKKDNIDWQGHRVMVYGKRGSYGSKSKRRVIPLTARVQPLLEGHFALHHEFGMRVRTLQRAVRAIANRASISRKVSPHVLRHTASVTAVQKGISLPALQRLLGHDHHLATTEIYLNLSPRARH